MLTGCGNVIALGGNHDVLAAWVIELGPNNKIITGTDGHVKPKFLIKRDENGYCTIRVGDEVFHYNKFTTNIQLLDWLDSFKDLNDREFKFFNKEIGFEEWI